MNFQIALSPAYGMPDVMGRLAFFPTVMLVFTEIFKNQVWFFRFVLWDAFFVYMIAQGVLINVS